MNPGVTYYQWKIPGENGTLLTPRSDPMEDEHPFDLVFASEQEAREELAVWGVEDEAEHDEWVLVTVTIERVR